MKNNTITIWSDFFKELANVLSENKLGSSYRFGNYVVTDVGNFYMMVTDTGKEYRFSELEEFLGKNKLTEQIRSDIQDIFVKRKCSDYLIEDMWKMTVLCMVFGDINQIDKIFQNKKQIS